MWYRIKSWQNTFSTSYNRVRSYIFSIQLFDGLSILIFLIAVLSFLWILFFESWQYNWDGSGKGFETFVSIYSFPIKSFGVFLALITLIYAIKRANTTEGQLKTAEAQLTAVIEQNRLSNYFKFREEFVKHFVHLDISNFIECINNNTNSTIENIYFKLFHKLYGSYNNFNENMLEDVRQSIDGFYENVYASSLNRKIIPKPDTDVEELLSDFEVTIETDSIVLLLQEWHYQLAEVCSQHIEQNAQKQSSFPYFDLRVLLEYYFVTVFLDALISFTGYEPTKSIQVVTTNFFLLLRRRYATNIWVTMHQISADRKNTSDQNKTK